MVGRILIEAAPARILISKPGHEVTSPSLQESQKIFDSNWFFAGQLIMCRYVSLHYAAGAAGHHDVMYPKALSYYPSGMVYRVDIEGGLPVIFPVLPMGNNPPGTSGRGRWEFHNDRARNIYGAFTQAATFGYLVIAVGAA